MCEGCGIALAEDVVCVAATVVRILLVVLAVLEELVVVGVVTNGSAATVATGDRKPGGGGGIRVCGGACVGGWGCGCSSLSGQLEGGLFFTLSMFPSNAPKPGGGLATLATFGEG